MFAELYKAYKMLKGAYDIKKIADGPLAQAINYSLRVDGLIQEYRAKVSPGREKEMRKELAEIKTGLESLMTVKVSVFNVDGPGSAIKKSTIALAAIQASEFARLELVRIYWEQEEKHLPQDEPNIKAWWREKRQAYLRILPMYKTLATQMTGAALRAQREVEQSMKNQSAARDAAVEVRRQNEKDAADQLKMLQQDNEGFVNDERSAVIRRNQYLAFRKWAEEQDQRMRELVQAGDELYLAN